MHLPIWILLLKEVLGAAYWVGAINTRRRGLKLYAATGHCMTCVRGGFAEGIRHFFGNAVLAEFFKRALNNEVAARLATH